MSDNKQFLALSNTENEVNHISHLSEHMRSLCDNEEYSDVILHVEGKEFKGHKVVLAARSSYFRALFFGGLKESQPECESVELKDTSATAFKILLQYVYTGKMSLSSMEEDTMYEMLGQAHQYGFVELESAISEFLSENLTSKNVCQVFNVAHFFQLTNLCDTCFKYMDRRAESVLQSDGFASLSKVSMMELIKRDSFCCGEIQIFLAVWAWAKANTDEEDVADIIDAVRLPLMGIDELLFEVRPSKIVPDGKILDAIAVKRKQRNIDLKYRGCLLPEENVVTTARGAQVISGELSEALLDGDRNFYDLDHGFTRHPIDHLNSQGIVIKLGMQCIINYIRLLLWDRDTRSYSYYVEVSMDSNDWVRVVDHSSYLCRSWQRLHFETRVCRYIRIVGTHNTVNRVFHLVAVEAMFTNNTFKLQDGLLVPTENVATISRNAHVLEGVSRSRNALINGDIHNYDWDSGYTCHQLGSGSIVIQLAQPVVVNSMRLLLWDCDDRCYSYYIAVSTDQQNWETIADQKEEECKGWQNLSFDDRTVTFIKIVGTHNTANEVFHCVHFECPVSPTTSQALNSGERPSSVPALQLEINDGGAAADAAANFDSDHILQVPGMA